MKVLNYTRLLLIKAKEFDPKIEVIFKKKSDPCQCGGECYWPVVVVIILWGIKLIVFRIVRVNYQNCKFSTN